MKAVAYTDGRGNAGTGACACVVRLEDGTEHEASQRLNPDNGGVTNNVAEYEGVILALVTALEHGVTELSIFSDSQLIVNQVNGQWKIKENSLAPLRDRVWEEAVKLETVSIAWVPREQNSHADGLCRKVDRNPSARPNPFSR